MPIWRKQISALIHNAAFAKALEEDVPYRYGKLTKELNLEMEIEGATQAIYVSGYHYRKKNCFLR